MTVMNEDEPQMTPSAGRSRAVAAVIDQAVVAGTSFILMLFVQREIGKSALGTYVWLIIAMSLITALHTAWVGDSLTVMDRFAADVRSGLVASTLVFATLSVAIATALACTVLSWVDALTFGIMVGLWGFEEIGRRIFMARMTFVALVTNDIVYAIGTFITLGILWTRHGSLTLPIVIYAMLVGALVSILAARVQLPSVERAWQRPSLKEARGLGSFAIWRSGQAGIRPLAQFAVRTSIIVMFSTAANGELEIARLFGQPAMTYVSGVASLLLPMYAAQESGRRKALPLPAMTALLVLPVAIYSALIIGFKTPIGKSVFHHAQVSTFAVLGWLAIAVMFAAGQPVANLLVARKQSRQVFVVRAVDSAIGVVAAVLLVKFVSVNAAPWALAAGMLVGTIWLARSVGKFPAQFEMPGLPAGDGERFEREVAI